mgnify:CR=1 FL=1
MLGDFKFAAIAARKLDDALNAAFAVGAGADDYRAVVFNERAAEDFAGGCAGAVEEDGDGEVWECARGDGAGDFFGVGPAAGGDDDAVG